MEEICKKHLKQFTKISDNEVRGFTQSKEEYKSFLFELTSNGFSYSTTSSAYVDSKFVMFESGFRCTNIRRMYLQCVHGDISYEINKSNSKQDHPSAKKTRFHIQNSKKIGCQSKLNVKIRHVYPEYGADPTNQTNWMKSKISKELKRRISEDPDLKKESFYFIHAFIGHNHPVTGQQIPIHKELRSRIQELVENGITSTPAIKLHLNEKVREMFKDKQAPDNLNSAFFPTNSVIYAHIYRTLFSMKGSKSDQEALENKIKNEVLNMEDNYADQDISEQQSERTISGPQQEMPNRLILREKLKNLMNMSYNVEDGEYLDTLLKNVSSMEKELESRQKKRRKFSFIELQFKKKRTTNHKWITRAKKKIKSTNKFQGRIGETADMWKAALNCELDLD